MKRFLLAAICVLTALVGSAQQRSVSGRVTDASDGGPLPGVSIILKGTSTGTTTDANGDFSIDASADDVLSFSFIGYETQEVAVGQQTSIDVQLPVATQTLGEVVVIGYGTRERKDLTGSISAVKSKDIESIPFASPQFALQGKATGVRIVNQSGDPSAGPQIFVRGIGTWDGSAQPLYVIDGQIITAPSNVNQDVIGSINLWTLINPNDIESMSVLKDASATAIYGSRGANGVILITTKRGRRGKPVVEFNSQYGVQNTPKFDVLNTRGYVDLTREAYNNSIDPDISLENNLYGRNEAGEVARLQNYSPQFDPQSPYFIGEDGPFYDWQGAVRNENAVNQNYNVKVSGAGEAADYYISLGYTQQESVLEGAGLDRYNLAVNINTDVGKYIRTGFNYKITYQESDDSPVFGGNDQGLIEGAVAPPWQPIYDASNRFGFAPVRRLYNDAGAWDPYRLYGVQTRSNGLASENVNMQQFNLMRNMGQAYIEIEPLRGLTIRGALSLDYTYQQRVSFSDVLDVQFSVNAGNPADANPAGSYGNYDLRTNKFYNYQADLIVNYAKSINQHNFSALFSIQDQHFKNWTESFGTNNAQTRDRDRLGVTGAQGDISGFSGRSQKFWYGYVGRLSYNFNNRYYVDLSMRRDGSVGFPDDKRWGNFPSAALAWRVSDESFMENFAFLNDLKLRAGWGQTGNDEVAVGRYAYLSGVTNAGSYSFGSGNGDPIGNYLIASSISGFPNQNLTWETVTQTYVGFDATFLNNKMNATVEYFNRVTDDILQVVTIPPSVGTASPVFNIGQLVNRGLEMELGYSGSAGALTYGISGNISFVKNEVTSLYDNIPLETNFGRVEEGRSIGHIWGYKVGGIFQTQAEIDAYYAAHPDETIGGDAAYVQPGDMYFLDVYGNPTETERFYSKTPDGVINAFDMTELGNTIPGHTYGLNLSAGFKGLDLTVNFYGEGNVDKVNLSRQRLEAMDGSGLNQSMSTNDRWTMENPSNSMPRAVAGDPAGNNRFSSRWVENAGFFRLNTWQVGYSIPSTLLDKTSGVVSRFRVFVGGQNNMLITHWSTLDPVNDAYPLPKSFFVGLNASF
jgi:TonB-dependent starch-binding outer membrane protein SusC